MSAVGSDCCEYSHISGAYLAGLEHDVPNPTPSDAPPSPSDTPSGYTSVTRAAHQAGAGFLL
jgi:hypothetical protein